AGFGPVLPPRLNVRRAYARLGVIAIPLGDDRLLTELLYSDIGLSKKYADPSTRVEPLRVGGHAGIWLEGGRHVLVYLGPDGKPIAATLRLAGNTLIWQAGVRVFRLEGALTPSQALQIAHSLATVTP